MATVTASPTQPVPQSNDVPQPGRLARIPNWALAGGVLLVLLIASAYMRTRYISVQFWMDEAITTGISSHSLSAIPGILRHDGSPPLFYFLLHFWMEAFGTSEAATHSLSLLFGLLTVPVGMWAGWSLFGLRAGVMAATLFAFNAFLTRYAIETRMYELMGLLGLVATAAFIHAFVYRRRGYLILFAAAQALMFYTHAWGIFFAAGAVLTLIPIWLASDDRRGIVRDALMAFVGAGVLFLPWLPNFIYQSTHTGAPWATAPGFGAPILISNDLLGGPGVTVALGLGAIAGLSPLLARRYRGTREATVLWTLILLPVATLAVAWVASQANPAFVSRYFAPVLPAMLLLAAWGCARSGALGWVVLALAVILVLPEVPYVHPFKSNLRDVSGELTPRLHRGDLVVVAQPEQVALSYYYLPAGLRYANTIGPVRNPTYMNWVDALSRLQRARPAATLGPLVASLKPGQQLLYLRPITEGSANWEAPWTRLVRRRAAQWGALLASDHQLSEVAWAPHSNNLGYCCVADSAILYRKS
jgi:mannosyltransferase